PLRDALPILVVEMVVGGADVVDGGRVVVVDGVSSPPWATAAQIATASAAMTPRPRPTRALISRVPRAWIPPYAKPISFWRVTSRLGECLAESLTSPGHGFTV